MTQSFSRWHFHAAGFFIYSKVNGPPLKGLHFFFFFYKQDFSKSWMSHPSALSILSSQTVGRGWRSAYFSYRAHWSELVNRSPPAHWLCRRVEEVRLRRRRRSDQTVERAAVLPLTCAAALSLTRWQSAPYVWKWAVITIICVPSLVFYNGAIILFFPPLRDAFFLLPPLLPPSPNPPPFLSLLLMPSTSFTLSLIQMTGTGALLIMLWNISPPCSTSQLPYRCGLSADASAPPNPKLLPLFVPPDCCLFFRFHFPNLLLQSLYSAPTYFYPPFVF